MSKFVTFILSNMSSFQLYVPLFKIYKNNDYQIKLLLRDNYAKVYATPVGKEEEFKDILKDYDIKLIEIKEWLKNAGITYCVDGDMTCGKRYCYIESFIVNLITPMEPEERNRFFIISLLANTDYIWSYSFYYNLVDYIIFPHKDYLFSYYCYQMKKFSSYRQKFGFTPDAINGLEFYQKHLEEAGLSPQYPMIKNILHIPVDPKYECPQMLKPILMEQINSSKNLFLGTPKYDFSYNVSQLYKKYDIPLKAKKIAIIFHPEYRMTTAYSKYGKEDFKRFYRNIHRWLHDLGFYIIVKDRLKGMNNSGKQLIKREKTGDLHIYNHCLFPNPSIELLYLAKVAVIFSSSAIEENFYTDTVTIDVKIDGCDRHGFLRKCKNCYVIDNIPEEAIFKKKLKMRLNNQKTDNIKKNKEKYFPDVNYSKAIFKTINYIWTNKNKTNKINNYINKLSENMDDSYLKEQIYILDKELFKNYEIKETIMPLYDVKKVNRIVKRKMKEIYPSLYKNEVEINVNAIENKPITIDVKNKKVNIVKIKQINQDPDVIDVKLLSTSL